MITNKEVRDTMEGLLRGDMCDSGIFEGIWWESSPCFFDFDREKFKDDHEANEWCKRLFEHNKQLFEVANFLLTYLCEHNISIEEYFEDNVINEQIFDLSDYYEGTLQDPLSTPASYIGGVYYQL